MNVPARLPFRSRLHTLALGVCLGLVPFLPGAAAEDVDCRAQVKAAVAGMFHHGPFEITAEMTGGLGDGNTVAEVVPGVGIHSITTFDQDRQELTVLGDRLWRRSSGADWQEAPIEEDIFAAAMQPAFFDQLDEMQRMNCNGVVSVDGIDYLSFGFGGDTPDLRVDITLFLDPVTRRIMRVEGSTTIAGSTSQTVGIYRYDATLSVAPPVQ